MELEEAKQKIIEGLGKLTPDIPVVSEEEEQLKPEKVLSRGEIPSPVNIPSGCSFHLRCPYKMDICVDIDPDVIDLGDGHTVRCHLFPEE